VSIQEFLDRAAQDRPLVLVLEDLHWADESSVLLLEHLAPRLGETPILVIGSYRDVEVSSTHPLTRVVTQLSRRNLITRIALKRLPIDDVTALIGGLSGQEPPPGLVQAIYTESEGNPFFIEEVFLHLAESGRLFDEEGRFLPNLRVAENDVPQSVRLVIGERLGRLSQSTRDVLAAAAASGRVFWPQVAGREPGTSIGPTTSLPPSSAAPSTSAMLTYRFEWAGMPAAI
jgi:predicted ATPase